MKPVASGDEITFQLLKFTFVPKMNSRSRRAIRVSKIADPHVRRLEHNLSIGFQPRRDQIFHHLMLAVDRYAFTAGQLRKIYAMRSPSKSKIDAVVHQSLFLEPFPHA